MDQQEQDGTTETTGATENGGAENGGAKSKHWTKQRNGRPVSLLIFYFNNSFIFVWTRFLPSFCGN